MAYAVGPDESPDESPGDGAVTTKAPAMTTLFDALKGLLRTLLKLLLLAVGAVLGLLALAFGLLLTAGLVVWALVRGRKPVQVQAFRWRGMPRPGATPSGEVVDVEAREVGRDRDREGADRVPAARALVDR